MKKRLGLIAFAALFAAMSSADTLSERTRIAVFKFADGLRFEFHSDPSGRRRGPYTDVVVKRYGTTIAHYSGLGLEKMYASPHGNLFVALSNSGLPTMAVAVFGEGGHLLLHADHSYAAFPWCERTATRSREWFDSQNPDVQFDEKLHIGGITLNDCRGKRMNLHRTVIEAMAGGLQRIERRVGKSVPAAESPPELEK
jgi:hypothetical protein